MIKKSFVLLSFILLIAGCATSEEKSIQDIEKSIQESGNVNIQIIEPEGFEVSVASVLGQPGGQKNREVRIGFDNKVSDSKLMSEDEIEDKEDQLNIDYIYGPYSDNPNFELILTSESMQTLIDPNLNFEPKTISDSTVLYQERPADNLLIVQYPYEGGVIRLDATLSDDVSKEDVWGYVEELLGEYKSLMD
ncbi:hypothetical protein [Piscibacillus salipiscarius]|uniref:Uncharacterized protein n=1 Tax=Piscibacillus salipiscarius TaxID=299480 RepID=A0ABW5Q9X3_9BACI|nr:hypothetical protein [Piscibacillus salipiscarius]